MKLQIKGMAGKACSKPCTGPINTDPKPNEFSFRYSFETPVVGHSVSSGPALILEDQEEWAAEADEGVLLKLLSVGDGNVIQRLLFSKKLFNMWTAQKWWAENRDMVMELWSVRNNIVPQVLPYSVPINFENEEVNYYEISFPLRGEQHPDDLNSPITTSQGSKEEENYCESDCLTSTPKQSSVNGCTKVEASSADASATSVRSSLEENRSAKVLVYVETEASVEENKAEVQVYA